MIYSYHNVFTNLNYNSLFWSKHRLPPFGGTIFIDYMAVICSPKYYIFYLISILPSISNFCDENNITGFSVMNNCVGVEFFTSKVGKVVQCTTH